MPADKNLILFTLTPSVPATSFTSSVVDLGMGGTPITHPLVARVFWGAAAATGTVTINVEAAFTSAGTYRVIAAGDFVSGPNAEMAGDVGVRFVTRRRYVRAVLVGNALTNATGAIMVANKSAPKTNSDL